MKTVVILFGEMGCGKTYWGKKFAEESGQTFFDGDDVVPPAMMERVRKFKPLSKEMVDDYVHNHLAPAILQRVETENYLFVAQALYRIESRSYIEKYLACQGVRVLWYPVKTGFFQNLRQIWSRPNGFRWVIYWLMNKPFFQNVPKSEGLGQLA